MRLVMLGASALLLNGCALFKMDGRNAAISPSVDADIEITRVSVSPAPSRREVATARPVGLVPCAADAPLTDSCWGRGDRHYLFPQETPEGLENSTYRIDASSSRNFLDRERPTRAGSRYN